MTRYLLLPFLSRGEDAALLALRVGTGAFLVDGVWDNIASAARMAEFAAFLRANGFAGADVWAPFSVWTQFAAGVLLALGLLTRWAGLVIAITFAVALWMVHWDQSLRDWWPALALLLIGAYCAARGGGRYALDTLLR